MEILIVSLSVLSILMNIFVGYMVYVTNIKMEDFKEKLTKIETTVTVNNNENKTLWKEVAIILKKLLELT